MTTNKFQVKGYNNRSLQLMKIPTGKRILNALMGGGTLQETPKLHVLLFSLSEIHMLNLSPFSFTKL